MDGRRPANTFFLKEIVGAKPSRRPQKRADYLLKYRRDFTLAVVEAKSIYKNPGDGLQQAKDYAQILGLKFAYSTNGKGIVEHDFFTGKDNDLETFPTPEELWRPRPAAQDGRAFSTCALGRMGDSWITWNSCQLRNSSEYFPNTGSHLGATPE